MPCLYVQYVIFLLSNVTTKIKNAEYDFIPVSVKKYRAKENTLYAIASLRFILVLVRGD